MAPQRLQLRSFAGVLAAVVVVVLAYLAIDSPLYDKMATAPLLSPLRAGTRQILGARFLASTAASLQKSSFLPTTTASPSLNRQNNQKHFSSSPPVTANMTHDKMTFKDAVKHRRTVYQLTKDSPVPDSKIEQICHIAIKDVPSSFNSQSTRLVVLLKDEHDKFWDMVKDILKAHVPEDKWEHTGQRLQGFRGGYGTILFYEDPEPVKKLQSAYAQYADYFPQWSEHTSAMHQYMLWTALEAEGFGCNLQHYNPLPDQKAAAEWKIPVEWSLKAQLVFGGEVEGARKNLSTKSEQPIGERLFIHGAK